MNKLAQKALKQLEIHKKEALARTGKEFPEKFYSVAEFFLTNPIFQPIVNEIDQEWDEDHAAYEQMAVGVLRFIDHICRNVNIYIQGRQIPAKVFNEINSLGMSNGESLVEIYKKLWSIKIIFKELPESHHLLFIHDHRPQVILLEKKVNELGGESERLRKLEKERSWEHLRRFRAIVAIYNAKEHNAIRDELAESGEEALLFSHDIRYQGLSRCMYPGKEVLDYNENFGMQKDKKAIKEICAIAERELGEVKKVAADVSNDKKIRIEKGDSDDLHVFVGIDQKEPIQKKSDRGKLALFFSKKKKATTNQLEKILGV